MRLSVTNLSESELLSILHDCEDRHRLIRRFGKTKAWALMHDTGYQSKNKLYQHKILNSFIFALDYFCIPQDVFWIPLTFVTFSPPALLAIGIVLGTAAICLGIYGFIKSYNKQKLAEQQLNNTFKLVALKKQALKELTLRANLFSNPADSKSSTNTNHQEIIVEKESAILTTIFSAWGLFATFWFMSDFTYALGLITLSTAMVGPIGLPIALITAGILGIFCGIKIYQKEHTEKKFESQTSLLNKEINKEKKHFDKKLLASNKTKKIHQNSIARKKINKKTKLNFSSNHNILFSQQQLAKNIPSPKYTIDSADQYQGYQSA